MKFEIFTTKNPYRREQIKDLVDIGFKFVEGENPYGRYNKDDEGWIMHIQSPHFIELNTLQDLIDLSEKVGPIIVSGDEPLEIYNDHHS